MKISILIAAYNVELYIKKCITSCYIEDLASQYEIIVVNDGSTDQTGHIIYGLSAISNLKIINKKNEGLGAARNTAIVEAVGEYIWMLDGDDFIETSQLNFLLQELEISKLDMYCMNYNITDQDGVAYDKAYDEEKVTEVFEATDYYHRFKANSYTWQYIFKRSVFINNQLFFKASINMQDSEILPKIIYHSESVKYLDIICYNYVQHSQSFTNATDFSKRFRYFESIVAVNQSLEKFRNNVLTTNTKLAAAIQDKQQALHHIVFSHIVYFQYTKENLNLVFKFLNENGFYPFLCAASGKLKFVKFGLNHFPVLTKKIIDFLRPTK